MITSKDLYKKVTRGAKYTTSIHLPGMPVGKALYAAHPIITFAGLTVSSSGLIWWGAYLFSIAGG